MWKKSKTKLFVKRAFACILSAVTVAAVSMEGYVAPAIEAEAAEASSSSNAVLSNEDRGVIYANSRTDFRDETIYFVITTRFYDGDTSNNYRSSDDEKAQNPADDPSWRGDFKGLIDKLDYIKALGFTAIWITPVVENDSGYDYHGYHAYNFSAVDTRYESNGITYQDLIDAVHAKGMKIIQDVVLNHTCNWGEENLLQITSDVYEERNQVVMNGTGDPDNIYHHNGFCGGGDWDNYNAQITTIHDDCFDLETENPTVYNYLVDCYTNYINMGVDAFRVDTVKHISRLTFNSVFLPAFRAAGGDDFYMFGEVCTKGYDVWYRGVPPISTCFYTWADPVEWTSRWSNDLASNEALVAEHYTANMDTSNQPTSDNAFLNGNEYHTPDYSESSGMNVIDFQMHWSFDTANGAFNTALQEDRYFNDSTWNVVYVDSHDYAPDQNQTQRYTGGTDAWAENLSLMFTFRGIPCIYYGSEIEFQAGAPIDVGPNQPLSETGRAYYGDNIEGTVLTSDFTVFGNVSGQVAETLNAPLSQHIMRLNRLRQAIPALRKGQYSTEDVSGNIAFKRRYTDDTTDSFALVAISGDATFNNIPNGTYVDAVTGDVKYVTNGTLTASVSGKGNMKIYVLDTEKTPAPGRVITNGDYLTDGGAAELIEPVDVEIVNPTSITLDKSSVSILEAETANVTAAIAPSNATYKNVTWTSSNTSVATVNGGKITGIAPGTATITAKTTNGLTASVKVTVSVNTAIIKPTGVTVSPSVLTLVEGDTGTLTGTVAPSNATNKTLTWSTSNSSVATVNSSGVVTAVSEGTATIKATTFNGYTASATVTVEAKEIPYIENGLYFEKPSTWGSNINVYFFSSDQTVGAEWPGTAMTDLGDGIYGISYTSADSNLMVIFNDGSSQTADLKFVNNGYYNSSGYVKTIVPTSQKGKVIVKYVDESGNVLSSQTLTDVIGTDYATTAMTFDGYTLLTTPSNASGKFTAQDITVTYVYKSNGVTTSDLTVSAAASATSVAVGSNVTITASADGGTGSYTYSFLFYNKDTGAWYRFGSFTSAKSYTWTASSTGNRAFYVEVKDSAGTVVRSSAINVNVTAQPLSVTGSASTTSVAVGSNVTITASASGGTGNYTYSFLFYNKDTGAWYRFGSFTSAKSYTWTASSTGNRAFYVEVKDSAGTVVRSSAINVNVTAQPLSVTGSASASSVAVGSNVTITASAAGGTGSYTYSFLFYNKDTGAWYRFGSFAAAKSYTWTASSTGNRAFYVEVKDSAGTVVRSAAINVNVTAQPLSVTGKASATNIGVETTILITAGAAGGSGSYTYSFLFHNKDTNAWYRFGDFAASNTLSWMASSAGNRDFYVEVKDSAGTVVRSSAINVSVI